jgi:hypothetical protein
MTEAQTRIRQKLQSDVSESSYDIGTDAQDEWMLMSMLASQLEAKSMLIRRKKEEQVKKARRQKKRAFRRAESSSSADIPPDWFASKHVRRWGPPVEPGQDDPQVACEELADATRLDGGGADERADERADEPEAHMADDLA